MGAFLHFSRNFIHPPFGGLIGRSRPYEAKSANPVKASKNNYTNNSKDDISWRHLLSCLPILLPENQL